MAEENINTDKNTRKATDELTSDELSQIAGGTESNVKVHSQEESPKAAPEIRLNHNQTLVRDLG